MSLANKVLIIFIVHLFIGVIQLSGGMLRIMHE